MFHMWSGCWKWFVFDILGVEGVLYVVHPTWVQGQVAAPHEA